MGYTNLKIHAITAVMDENFTVSSATSFGSEPQMLVERNPEIRVPNPRMSRIIVAVWRRLVRSLTMSGNP
jgi:hypothetical protein